MAFVSRPAATKIDAMPQPRTDLKILDRATWRAGVRVIRNGTEESGTIVEGDGEIKVKWDDGRTSYYRRKVPTDIRLEEASDSRQAVTHEVHEGRLIPKGKK
jgi:hypothetical protein